MRILVVEDDRAIADFLTRSIREAGYAVTLARTGAEAEAEIPGNDYDAVVLDLGLPDCDGMALIQSLRGRGMTAPILILSARRSVDDRVRGLELGADDYMTKPFATAELVARIRNLLRRTQSSTPLSTRLRSVDLEIDLLRREARRGTRRLQLTTQEFSLLEYLCRNAGRVVTRSMILDHVWNMHIQPNTNVVDVHIYRLRSKVDQEGEPPLIRTLRGVGYVLRDR